MATTAGLARVAQINKTIASQGQAAPNAMAGKNAVTSSSSGANPADMPGYDPRTDPTSSLNVGVNAGRTVEQSINAPDNTPIAPGNIGPTNSQPVPSINTSPYTTQASPEQVQQVANATKQVNDLSQQYKAAAALANKSGISPAQNPGTAMSDTKQFLGATQPAPESPSIIGAITETDSNFDSILTDYDKFMSPPTQRKTLVEEYTQLSKSLGIEGLNAELLNSKRIIEGTEDDIRSEIAAVGGTGTDSQVLALANARNKSLIKNYNFLLESRDSAMTQLNTMMQLSAQDRQAAEAEFDRKMNFTFKVAEFKQKAIDNSKSNYNAIVAKVGYQGLLAATNGNAYEQAVIEKTLGLGNGGLQRLASIVNPDEALDRKYKQAQIDNIYSQIGERNNTTNSYGTIDGKIQNANQSAANSYANRLNEADVVISNLGDKFTGNFSMLPSPNFLKSGDRQAYEQAQNNFITAVLRRESGASIAPTEFETARKTYFPQPGDKDTVLKNKEKARNTVINNFYREANVNRPVLPGQIIESNGKKYKVDMDGVTLKEI